MRSTSHHFVFGHINKTGGTSVVDSLAAYADSTAPDHATAVEIREGMGEQAFDRAFKFTFVRNPWDKVVSQYFYRSSLPQEHPHYTRLISFPDWVRQCYTDEGWMPASDWKWRLFRPQLSWITDASGKLLVDFTGRFENLASDFQKITGKIGVNATLLHQRRSEHRPYRDYYDEETRAIVEKKYRPDIEKWGYVF